MIYERLNPTFKTHVDALVAQVAALEWRERRLALESFRNGIAKCTPAELAVSLKALGVEPPGEENDAESLFRVLLTACLERLDEPTVDNPDQAAVYARSLDRRHVAGAEDWLTRTGNSCGHG